MTIRRPALTLAAAILVLSASACEDLIGIDDAILIENESEATITRVFFRDCGTSDWGSDRLGAEEVINPNESRGFDVSDGCYDLRADFLSGSTTETDVEIDGDQFVWRITSSNFIAPAAGERGFRAFVRRLLD